MSRGGSRRGGDRGDFAQVGPDGWAVAGSGPPRPPPKAGDLSNFGKINKTTPMTFGPSSVFAGKKESKRESLSRTSSSSNMFSMLSQNPEAGPDPTKGSHSHSRKTSVDLSNTGVTEAPAQRKRLILAPRSKPTTEEQETATPKSESESEDEAPAEPEMTEEQAKKKIEEDSKEFFAVRNLDEAEVYFTNLPATFHSKLVDKFASAAVERKEPDAQLVADFFARAAAKEMCIPAAFEEGLSPIAEIIDDIAIDAPKAPNYFALMVKGAGLDEERRTRLASKSMDSEQLLALLS